MLGSARIFFIACISPELISFHADAVAGTCQSLFLWFALIPPVAVRAASVANRHAVGNDEMVFQWPHGLR